VIARDISHGTRCASGSRSYAQLARVIEAYRLRKASTHHYLAEGRPGRTYWCCAPRLAVDPSG
jgi:hypothetical protein